MENVDLTKLLAIEPPMVREERVAGLKGSNGRVVFVGLHESNAAALMPGYEVARAKRPDEHGGYAGEDRIGVSAEQK